MKFKSDIEVQAGLKDSSGAIGASGQVLSSTGSNVSWINQSMVANDVQNTVKAGVAINKGQAVYVTGADGTNIIVGLASNATEATSSKTLGLLNATVAVNGFADVVQIGRLAGLNTIGAVVGDPVWLGTGGNLIYGLTNKPYAPAHLVFIGVVTRVNANNGEIFITVQNGFELKEIHDVDIITTVPINGDVLGYNGTLWVNKTIAQWLGYTPANASGTTNYVSKFTGTSSIGNSQLFDNGTKVGIGTTSPASKLTINTATNENVAIGSLASIPTGRTLILQTSATGGSIETYSSLTGGYVNTLINPNGGNVGIGTTSPTQLLHVVGNARITGALYDSSNSAGASGQVLSSTGTGTAWVTGGGGGGISGSGTTNYIPKFTGSTAVGNSVIYESGGSIGIGTTSPSAKLHVAGAQILDDGAGRITLALGSAQNEIYSTTTGFAAYSNLRISASNTIFTNAGTERMRITSSGTIGIGTTTPGATLDVQGSLKVDSGPYAFLLVDGTDGVLGAQAGNGGFSYAGGGPGVGGAGDSMAALTSRNTANTDDAVFGLQGIDSSTGEEYFFTAKNVLKSSGPSEPSTPKRYMEVYDMNSGVTYWINLYQ